MSKLIHWPRSILDARGTSVDVPTDFSTNRKPIYDFLLVINSNLPPILRRFQAIADYWSNVATGRVSRHTTVLGGAVRYAQNQRTA